MKNSRISLLILILVGLFGVSFAQESAKTLSIKIADQEKMFVLQDNLTQIFFTLKGLEDQDNIKYYTEKIKDMPNVKKFGIKVYSGQVADERECMLVLSNENCKSVFPQVMTQLGVSEITIGGKTLPVSDFVTEYIK